MNKKIREMQAKKAGLVASARAITDKASAENRDLTAEEVTSFEGLTASVQSLNASISREELLASEELATGVVVRDDAVITVAENLAADPKRGFKSFGDFASVVKAAALNGGATDKRLGIGAVAPTTFGNESNGVDGGFLVPPEFSKTIWTQSLGEDSFMPYTDDYTIGSNSMVFPSDETTPWGTDGVRAFWQAEASVATQTKPKFRTTTLRMHKLMALVPLTDELIADALALDQYLSKKVGDSIRWKTNEAILFGLGNGMPVGALTGNAAVVVPKDSGQATGTVSPSNLAKMIARLPVGSFPRAFWLINNDVLPALFTLTLGNYPIYMPAGGPSGGIQGSPYGTLLGRPIMVSQHAGSFSTQGDIQLHDLSYYRTITKADGIQTATSMHLYFDADATAFRTTFRMDGQPAIVNPIAPAKGATLMSPFLQLQAR